MKTIILYIAVTLVTYAVRMRGWTNKPKPDPYPQDEQKAWWRWIAERQIQSTDLPGAFRACITELKKELGE